MDIDQAIFTSACTNRMKGYQLIAQSAGVKGNLAQKLSLWSPSQSALLETDTNYQSINFFPLGGGHFGISRTIYGGPEYSNRGALQTVTLILLVSREQLGGYEFNPLSFAKTAQTFGYLRLPTAMPTSLPRIALPQIQPLTIANMPTELSERNGSLVDRVTRLLEEDQCVAVTGSKDPLTTLGRILLRTPAEQRLSLSFTTGLRPSGSRPFRIHFLAEVDVPAHSKLAALDIARVASDPH